MRLFKNVFAVLIFAVILVHPPRLDAASSRNNWQPPTKLFETTGRASEAEVVADSSGAVHVFWAYAAPNSDDAGWGQAIYYARLQDGKWTEPVDVLISPGNRVARMHSVVVDNAGYLQIVWSASNAILYSRAYAPEAETARSWITPLPLSAYASTLEPAITADRNNGLYVVWTQAKAGLMFVRSDDGGQTWSAPKTIFEADADNELATWGRIALDKKGRIHVVLSYSVEDSSGRYGRTDAQLLYYLRSEDRGETWNEPLLITPEPDFGEINVVTFGSDTVHLVWNGRAGRHGRYHRWSQDGGQTWSTTEEVIAPGALFGNAGLTGFPAIATDSTGALHLVSTGSPTGMTVDYYMEWLNGVWSVPVSISAGIDGNGVTGKLTSLEQPSVAISEGNRLHVVFHDGFERIWYTSVDIDAPHEPPVPYSTTAPPLKVAPAPSPTLAIATNPTPLGVPTLSLASKSPSSGWPVAPIMIGVAPAALLVVVVALVSRMRRRN